MEHYHFNCIFLHLLLLLFHFVECIFLFLQVSIFIQELLYLLAGNLNSFLMTFSLSESILNFKRSSFLPNHLLYFSYLKAHFERNSIAQLFQRHYYISYCTIRNTEYIVLHIVMGLDFHFQTVFSTYFYIAILFYASGYY